MAFSLIPAPPQKDGPNGRYFVPVLGFTTTTTTTTTTTRLARQEENSFFREKPIEYSKVLLIFLPGWPGGGGGGNHQHGDRISGVWAGLEHCVPLRDVWTAAAPCHVAPDVAPESKDKKGTEYDFKLKCIS